MRASACARRFSLALSSCTAASSATGDLQKSPHLQKSRPIDQHNGQHERKFRSHRTQSKSLGDFSRLGVPTSIFACAAHCVAQWAGFLANAATSATNLYPLLRLSVFVASEILWCSLFTSVIFQKICQNDRRGGWEAS